MISEDEAMMPRSRTQLEELLSTLSKMRVLGPTSQQIEPLSGSAADACKSCPHHRGKVKLCGPR